MGYLLLDRINNISVTAAPRRGLARATLGLNVPGGWGEHAANGTNPESLELNGVVSCAAHRDAAGAFQSLCEIVDNPALEFQYFHFPAPWEARSGWYVIDSFDPGAEEPDREYPFSLRATRIGTLGSHKRGTFFEAGLETYTGWGAGTLTTAELLGLPNGASDVLGWSVYETRTAQGGTVPVIHNPTRQAIAYTLPNNPTSWYRAECEVFDTVYPGQTDERNWRHVYSPRHVFTGDCVIQNGLLRFRFDSSGVQHCYAWQSITTPYAWLEFGQHKLDFDGAGKLAPVKRIEVTYLTPEIIRWRETRQYGTDVATLICSLRRGSRFARVELKTFTRAISTGKRTGLTLYSGGELWYKNFFNDTDSKADGGGNCALGSANYELAYAVGRNVLAGFVLFDKPATAQPYDSNGSNDYVTNSLAWGIGDTYSYGITAIPYDVSGLPGSIATARAAGLVIAQEALWDLSPYAVLLEAGRYV